MASASEAKWQIGRDTLLERNKYMLNNSLMSDVKFAFPNKETIPAHKYVLAISSPVFFAMFYGGLAEQGETIDITDCDPDIFLQFVRFLYSDYVDFPDVNNAIQVWHLADKYDLPSLARECVNFVEAAMGPLNAFDVIPYARRFNHEGLENVCWEVIDYNAQEIVAHESFLDLKYENLFRFLQRSSLRVKETALFKAVDRWTAKRCEESNMAVDGANKRSVLGEELLKLVRFSLMSPKEFSQVVMPTEILLTTEVIDVFKQFTSVPIPGGLKFSIFPRAVPKQTTLKDLSICPLGNIYPDGSGRDTQVPQEIKSMQKTGMLTFMISRTLALFGVRILTYRPRDCSECRVSLCLSVFRGDNEISQIKNEYFIHRQAKRYVQGFNRYHGEIDVFFNRSIFLSENTCYTIKTHTDTSQNQSTFIWSESLQNSFQKSGNYNTTLFQCSGHYTECIPAFVQYKGEVMALLGKLEQNDTN